MILEKKHFENYDIASSREWYITNGLGSFCSATSCCSNNRKYHGLLCAAILPPRKRYMVLSKIDEILRIKNEFIPIYTNQHRDGTVIDGYKYIEKFEFGVYPKWEYIINNIKISKRICFIRNSNSIVLNYIIENKSSDDIDLELYPLVNYRDYHHNSKKENFLFSSVIKDGKLSIRLGNKGELESLEHALNISTSDKEAKFIKQEEIYKNMYYSCENERGLEDQEDHYIPGNFIIKVNKGCYKNIYLTCSMEDITIGNYDDPFKREEDRIRKLIIDSKITKNEFKSLPYIADKFIVSDIKGINKSIIAGYPHFGEWGRDTMISIEGLLLCLNRFEEAKQILLKYGNLLKDGLLPNTFNEENEEPIYNTVDTSLWYIEAVYKYLQYSLDINTVINDFYPVMKDIVYSYMDGTKYNIKMDSDFLLVTGDENTNLTWMDARVDGKSVTPRYGKAVEINALWYNALKVMTYIAKQIDHEYDYFYTISNKCRDSFTRKFWIEDKGYLFDTIEPFSDKLRPNQIFSVSLSFPVLDGKKAKSVVDKVFKELYTPYGLKTLDSKDSEYMGQYSGSSPIRDLSYHQGTVWPYLMGHFIKAYLNINENNAGSKKLAYHLCRVLIEELDKNCIDSIYEIYDGNEPHISRGCFSQAWSIAELIRILNYCRVLQ